MKVAREEASRLSIATVLAVVLHVAVLSMVKVSIPEPPGKQPLSVTLSLTQPVEAADVAGPPASFSSPPEEERNTEPERPDKRNVEENPVDAVADNAVSDNAVSDNTEDFDKSSAEGDAEKPAEGPPVALPPEALPNGPEIPAWSFGRPGKPLSPGSPSPAVPTIEPARYVEPLYPEAARRSGIEGTVVVKIGIDLQGRVAKVDILQSSGSDLLDREVLRTVRLWRFSRDHAGDESIHQVVFRLES